MRALVHLALVSFRLPRDLPQPALACNCNENGESSLVCISCLRMAASHSCEL